MAAPLAVSDILFPEHIATDEGSTVTVGVGFTVIVTESILIQLPVVPVTV